MKMPERPMRLFSSAPNVFTAPMHVPYTPEKKVSSRPFGRKQSDVNELYIHILPFPVFLHVR